MLVDATHTVVQAAQRIGRLEDRIDKQYICYLPDKEADSEKYPTIAHADCSVQRNNAPYMSRYIAEQIRTIDPSDTAASHEKEHPTVLVIGPNPFLGQIEEYLRTQFPQVVSREQTEEGLDTLFAYRLLVSDGYSRLAWRILLQILRPSGWETAINEALATGAELKSLLDASFVELQLRLAAAVEHSDRTGEVQPDARSDLVRHLSVAEDAVEDALQDPDPVEESELDRNEPVIRMTSLMGAKGLQAEHAFIVGVNAGHFPKSNNNPTDVEVSQLLVALTRARKSCTIVSTRRLGNEKLAESVFTSWLRPHITSTYVNRDYLEKIDGDNSDPS